MAESDRGHIRDWCSGYGRPRVDSRRTDLYNTDMVLYYLDNSIPNRDVPTYLIDTNVRIDYGKLRHLLVVGRQLNGNFDLLRDIIGEQQVDTRIQPSFPLERLTDPYLSVTDYYVFRSEAELGKDTRASRWSRSWPNIRTSATAT